MAIQKKSRGFLIHHQLASINTALVERSNLTLRNHSKNLTRKTICFAKLKQGLLAQLCIVATYYNFSKTHSGLTLKLNTDSKKTRRTPAMAAKIIDRVWSLDEILAYPMT
ncbi:MAG: IS1 family transposase [Desulfobulbaceae bacterium]|nr:IS1 family transposase [Desulfobulbaceae bacterium]